MSEIFNFYRSLSASPPTSRPFTRYSTRFWSQLSLSLSLTFLELISGGGCLRSRRICCIRGMSLAGRALDLSGHGFVWHARPLCFISGIRNCPNKEQERLCVNKELSNVRTCFKNEKSVST